MSTSALKFIGIVVGLAAEGKIARSLSSRVLISGGDPELAMRHAQELVQAGASTLMSFGIAGGLSPNLPSGALIVADEVVTELEDYPAMASCAERVGARTGAIYGGDSIVATPAEKAELRQRTGALAVDLETGPVARVAKEAGIPFIAVRAIADPSDHGLPPAALLPLSASGQPRLMAVLWSVATHPGQIPALIRTAKQTRAAMTALKQAARRLAN